MTTTKQFNIKKHFPTKFKLSAEGYYNKVVQLVVSDEATKTVSLTEWPTPQLTYMPSNVSAGIVSLNSGDFPDHTYRKEDLKVLMPYNNGQKYDTPSPIQNEYLVNNNVVITGNVANFTGNNSILINRDLGNYSSLEITVKCLFSTISKNSAVVSDSTSTEEDFGIRDTNKFAIFYNGWTEGTTTVEANKWYFLKIITENNVTTFYSLEAGSYTYDTLPDISEWTLENTISSKLFSQNLYLGYDNNYTTESLQGSIDLIQSKILVDNEIFWEYPQTTIRNLTLYGCLESQDISSAHTYTAYSLKNGNNQRTVLADSAPSVSGYTTYKLTNINIPQHDLYSYSTKPSYNTVNLIGSVELNTNTGVLSQFYFNNYVELPVVFNPGKSAWEFQIKFLRTDFGNNGVFALGGAQEYRGVTLYPTHDVSIWFISSGNGAWDISCGTQGRYHLELNTVYYCKVQFTGSAYICYFSTDGTTWEEDVRFETSTPISNITLPVVFGTADSPSYQTFDGNIYLDGCYLKIGDEVVWSGLGKEGVWTKN